MVNGTTREQGFSSITKRTLGMFEFVCTNSKKTSIESNGTLVELLVGSSCLNINLL